MGMVKLNEEYLEKVKKHRKELHITQLQISKKLGWSLSRYQRFESGFYKEIEDDAPKKIKEEFGIDYSLLQENFASAVKKTIRFPQDLHDKIVFFQHEFECDSFSEAIIFCLRDYITNTELARTKYEMKDFFEELILQTYAKTLKEARYESSKYKHLLKYLEEKYGFESEYEQQLLNEIDNKKNHARY